MTIDAATKAREARKEGRQADIMRYLEKNHYVSIDEITALFSVTTQTARRDIMALEQEGKVRRLHGGATISTPVDPATYRQRRIDNAAEKERIGRLTAELVPDGAAVFIDTGTTCEAVARALVSHHGLRVVTYSLRVATTLSDSTNFAVAVPGGFVRQVDGGVFREETADYIKGFKFDVAIISVSGVDQEGDVGDDDHAEVSAVSAAMGQAERTVLAVDSSKFGRRALVRLCSLADVDVLVTDASPNGDMMRRLHDGGVEVRF